MDEINQNPNSQSSPQTAASVNDQSQSFPSDIPVAQPSDYFPPAQSVTSSKSYGTNKIIATLLSTLLLVAGLAAGVGVVIQPQLLKQKASDVVAECTPSLPCANGYLCVIGSCMPNSDVTTCTKGEDKSLPVCCTSECSADHLSCSGTNYICNSSGVNGSLTCLVKANSKNCGGENP